MKELKAFIHRNRAADVVHALFQAGFRQLSLSDVKGMLDARRPGEQDYSIEMGEDVINEVKLEVVLSDDARAADAARIIQDNAQTGQEIAGWIYVSELSAALPILSAMSPIQRP